MLLSSVSPSILLPLMSPSIPLLWVPTSFLPSEVSDPPVGLGAGSGAWSPTGDMLIWVPQKTQVGCGDRRDGWGSTGISGEGSWGRSMGTVTPWQDTVTGSLRTKVLQA